MLAEVKSMIKPVYILTEEMGFNVPACQLFSPT